MKDAKGHGSDSRGGPSAEQKTINQSRGRRGVAPGYAGRDVQGRTYPQTKPAMPIPGHDYHSKTNDELQFIQRDASAAAKNMQGMGNDKAEGKYLDQVNDASTVLGYRQRGGTDLSKGPAAAVGAAHGISGPATYGPGETWGSRYATGEQHTAALADQHGIGTDHLMSDSERSQKIADWRDKGTSDAQAREGIRAMFNLPSRE